MSPTVPKRLAVGLCLEGVAAFKQNSLWDFPGAKQAEGKVKCGAVR